MEHAQLSIGLALLKFALRLSHQGVRLAQALNQNLLHEVPCVQRLGQMPKLTQHPPRKFQQMQIALSYPLEPA